MFVFVISLESRPNSNPFTRKKTHKLKYFFFSFADIQLLAQEELAILKEASYTAVISRLVSHGINIDTTLEDLEAPLLSEEDVESDT